MQWDCSPRADLHAESFLRNFLRIWRSRDGQVILLPLQTYTRQGSEWRLSMSDWSELDDRIFSWLFLIAFMGIGILISLPTRPKFLFLVTSPALLCVYLVMLARNYRKKIPIPTFGRIVEYENRKTFTSCYMCCCFLRVFLKQ